MNIYEPCYLFKGESQVYGSPLPDFDENRAADLVATNKFTDVILLLEKDWGESLKEAYENKGIKTLHFPIKDFGVPSMDELQAWIPQIVQLANTPNHKILIHCQGGSGRTGLISACVLAVLKHESGRAAIVDIRQKIPHAVETQQQELCIENFVKKLVGQVQPGKNMPDKTYG